MLEPPTPAKRGANGKSAFSFAEVMFAVVILGIGFILVAAIFPVAIQQTQTTSEENAASATARAAANAAGSIPTSVPNPVYEYELPRPTPAPPATLLTFPPTVKNYVLGTAGVAGGAVAPPAIVVPFFGQRWDAIKGSIISASDPRYAYVPFYRRENGASQAQLIVVGVTPRNSTSYVSANVLPSTPASPPAQITTTWGIANEPATASTYTTIYPDTITIASGGPYEGCYATFFVPSIPPDAEVKAAKIGNPVGRTYLLGRNITGNQFEISAGDGLSLAAGANGLWGTKANPIQASDKPQPNGAAQWQWMTPSALQPTVAYVQMSTTPQYPNGLITLYGSATAPLKAGMPAAAVPGAFIIVADDYPFDPTNTATLNYTLPLNITNAVNPAFPPYPTYRVGSLNGRIFRLGQQVLTNSAGQNLTETFTLDPAYAMRPPDTATNRNAPSYSPDTIPNPGMAASFASPATVSANFRAKVYLIGAGPTSLGSTTVSGPAQDIGVFSSFFQVQ
jgi:hypothetical protein